MGSIEVCTQTSHTAVMIHFGWLVLDCGGRGERGEGVQTRAYFVTLRKDAGVSDNSQMMMRDAE